MADNRREQIMAAVLTLITGLTTTGSRVVRGRVYSLDTDSSPALSLYQGADEPLEAENLGWPKLDSELTVNIQAHVKSSSSQVDTLLNLIHKEVVIAMDPTAEPPLALSFCLSMEEGDVSQPDLSGDGDKPTATMIMQFLIKYRRSRNDPSA